MPKRPNFQKNLLLYSVKCEKKLNGNDVNEDFYLNFEINGLYYKGLEPRVRPIRPLSKNVIKIQKSSSLLTNIFEKKLNE